MSEKIVRNDALDYHSYSYAKPSYRLSKLVPIIGTQEQSLNTSGGQELVWELPGSKVFNMSKSYLNFVLDIPAGTAAAFTDWIFADSITPIRQIQLLTRSGLYLCDLNFVDNYTKFINKYETNYQEFLDMDLGDSAAGVAAGTCSGLRPSNSQTAAGTAGNNVRHDNTSSILNYNEPLYFYTPDASANPSAAQKLIFKIPFSMFKNTILSLDKDLLFDEILVLRVVFNSTNKILFHGTSQTNPTVAGGGAVAFTPANNTSVKVTNCEIFLAIEEDPNIVADIQIEKRDKGINLLIPYVYANKTSLSGGSQNITLRFNRGHGLRLLKVYHTAFHSTESVSTALDHSNVGGTKINNFYTMLNNMRRQEINMSCASTALDDYLFMRNKLKKCVISGSNMYQYNWVWCESFCDDEQEHFEVPQENLVQGLPLDVEQKWDLVAGVTDATSVAGLNHYSFSVCQKQLVINNSGIMVV